MTTPASRPFIDCDPTPEGHGPIAVWGHRPLALQEVINTLGNLLLAHDVPSMSRYTAGKIFHELSKPAPMFGVGGNALPASDYLGQALGVAIKGGGPLAELAKAINSIAPDLRWYRSRTGPFASINFVRGHAHALMVGPGGMEERDDVHIGATIMAPYGRFPDHRRKHPTVFLALSRAEVRLNDEDWIVRSPGGVFFSDEGQEFAMRCTGNPLLLLWCQRVRSCTRGRL
ncbi:hypothetical protein IB276_18740 [Ensifer sp. ENS04]|uniref:dimethylsulfonioproprionate lyase family protein n=1 Tax=Ensifer sp. ENS04 TaxID=2769281 RepID=UPI00177C5EA7|nr:dimethylsulfonioproprionate lyase family protein [Ensifer sp. ENS04]MBD9541494.1 hypothetical protein [Ensifer sp. ENS04]